MLDIYRLERSDNIETTPVKNGVSLFAKYLSRFKFSIAGILNKIKAPGLVREIEYFDELTSQRISVKNQSLYTVISIDGRDFYFNRLSGKFDGTGSGFTCI
jgi:hypothetical protein